MARSCHLRCLLFACQPGFDPADENKPHPTLENSRRRLEDMCGGTMKIEQREAGGPRVTVFVPG